MANPKFGRRAVKNKGTLLTRSVLTVLFLAGWGSAMAKEPALQVVDAEVVESVNFALVNLTASDDLEGRLEALETLRQYLFSLPPPNFSKEISAVMALLKTDKDVEIRRAIARWIIQSQGQSVRAELDEGVVHALTDSDSQVRQSGLTVASQRPIITAVDPLIKILSAGTSHERSMAGLGLGLIEHPRVNSVLIEAMKKDRDLEVRSNLAVVLYRKKDFQDSSIILTLFREADFTVKFKLLHAVNTTVTPKGLAILTMAIHDSDLRIRMEAVSRFGGGYLQDPLGVSVLLKVVEGPDEKLKSLAVSKLQSSEDPRVADLWGRLAKDPNPKIRVEAMSGLGKIRDVRYLPVLLEALGDEQVGVRVAAIGALGKQSDPRVIPALIPQLKDPRSQVRLSVISALPKKDDPVVRRELLTILSKETDVQVKSHILLHFGSLKDSESLEALEHAGETEGIPSLKMAAVQALSQRGKDGVDPLFRLLKSEKMPGIRHQLVHHLVMIKDRKALTALTHLIDDPDKNLRTAVVNAMASWGSEGLPALFLAVKKDPDPEIRKVAVSALITSNQKEALKVLREISKSDPDESVKLHAAQSLQYLDPQVDVRKIRKDEETPLDPNLEEVLPLLDGLMTTDQIPQLIQALADPNEASRQMNVEFIKRIVKANQEDSVRELAKILGDPNPVIRFEAVGFLEECRNVEVIPILEKSLEDGDPSVRASAAVLLHRRGMDTFPKLAKSLKDPDVRVRVWSVWALGRMEHSAKRAVPVLMEMCRDHEAEVREQSVMALGRIKDTAALQEVAAVLIGDSDPIVREAAALALGVMGDARAASALQRAIKDGHPAVRNAAQQALDRMGELEIEVFKKRPR